MVVILPDVALRQNPTKYWILIIGFRAIQGIEFDSVDLQITTYCCKYNKLYFGQFP
jgi:hypothetical protein